MSWVISSRKNIFHFSQKDLKIKKETRAGKSVSWPKETTVICDTGLTAPTS
jgi:hypothetical protein